MKYQILIALITLITSNVKATVVLDKKDLKMFNLLPLRTVNNTQTPTRIEQTIKGTTLVKLYLEKSHQILALPVQPFTIPSCDQQDWITLTAKSDDEKFEIKNLKGVYRLQAEIKCGFENHLIFKENSPEGELISIWNIMFLAKNFLTDIQRISFWRKKITVLWPSQGDYYSGEVNITLGHHWDVVAHELGHAIYHQARIGGFGGGSHKIDECYSHTLALSEGWATFFAGWIKLNINDADAKFEYLVPRRAPIQIENVPNDVCRGIGNEWRVASYLWDIIDTHKDIQGEDSQIVAAKIWDEFQDKEYKNIEEFKKQFEKNGGDKSVNDVLWNLNF